MRRTRAVRLSIAVAACLVLASAVAGCSGGAGSGATRRAAARLSLPAPAGPYPVGTVSLHLTDRSRRNPFASSPPYRELMVSIWYPATDVTSYPVAPYMPPDAAAGFGAPGGQAQQLLHVPPGKVDWSAIRTSGHEGAPVTTHGGPFPVLLFSPDLENPRALDTTVVQDMASRGYVVVTIDDTYEASEVEFPGGQIVRSQLPALVRQAQHAHQEAASLPPLLLAWMEKDAAVRVADVRFVLDELTAIQAGRDPDAEHQALPRNLAGALDLSRTGMFGESLGGMTAAQAMYEDPRIRAGVDLDGNDVGAGPQSNKGDLFPVLGHGLNRPFMIMATPGSDINTVPAWRTFWDHSTGWHLDLSLRGANDDHAYGDAAPLVPQIARELHLPASFATEFCSISPAKTVPAEVAYLSAFFGRWLRGQDEHLLDGPSPRYPEFVFVRPAPARSH
jgi:predicted dienelactone hydrolase